ncbi:MAG: circularly permuted type 2 ATP-grasp protein, partial [Gammaproteobacteria bacterium]
MLPPLLAHYAPPADRYDEVFAAPGMPRAHWARMIDELAGASTAALASRLGIVEREVRDSGVTYNVYADLQGLDRPWDLDVLPLVLPADEWAQLAQGVAQRARLLNAVLADLYGAASLLADGALPPSLVLGHGAYLRPAVGARPPFGTFLHSYAVDLARAPDGRWWVLGDRTQAPSGAGYALENRLLVARLFPASFRALRVARLAPFFALLRDSLLELAPRGDGPPLAVVLTPGPYNETYFEHSFLARYLGFPLVEGHDLLVRDGRLWLKTVEGLQRVHAILRRQDDAYCDPLELRADSALGVAGLTDCARRGSVFIANALGAGVLESAALLGFLPGLAQRLLGEPLALPSVATWWCGEAAACEDALAQAERLVFKSADPVQAFEPVFGPALDAAALARLREEVRATPARYVAQEWMHVSQAPTLTPRQPSLLGARSVGLRVFAIATAEGYRVMPGGLTRVAPASDPLVVSMQRGGGSKDTWVLTRAETDVALALPGAHAPGLTRGAVVTPSRTVENLFWFGRYGERCEDLARLLRVALGASFQERDPGALPLRALGTHLGLRLRADVLVDDWCAAATGEAEHGLPANLRQLARVAHSLRERISLDHWRAINRLVQDPVLDRACTVAEALEWLDRVVQMMVTLSGFALDGMTRDLGWRFLSLGRRLERLAFGSLALAVALEQQADENLGWLLELEDSIVTNRARRMGRMSRPSILALLMFDEENPRAL